MSFEETEELLGAFWSEAMRRDRQDDRRFHASAGYCVVTSYLVARLLEPEFSRVRAVSGLTFGELADPEGLQHPAALDHTVVLIDDHILDLTRRQFAGGAPALWAVTDPALEIHESISHARLRRLATVKGPETAFVTALRSSNPLRAGQRARRDPVDTWSGLDGDAASDAGRGDR